MDIRKILKTYTTSQITVGVVGSHSALEICSGAKKIGFRTLVVTQKGREKIYTSYFKADKNTGLGCVDQCIRLKKFSRLLDPSIQSKLRKYNTIFVPHRSFEAYLNFDYAAIERQFAVPIFGNRYLLKIEERGNSGNQYDLLQEAGIRSPKIFKNPRAIDRLCLIKVLQSGRPYERAFFLAASYKDYQKKVKQLQANRVIDEKQILKGTIEEFILGVQVNFNYFYSPLMRRLELLGTDMRRQTNLEGLTRVPAIYQKDLLVRIPLKFEEAGHIATTVLESLLEQIYEIGERFVKAALKLYPPGIIGPFALQAIIIPGPPQKEIVVVDVSPRMPGAPGIAATPYATYLYRHPMTLGERIAREIKQGIKTRKLNIILT